MCRSKSRLGRRRRMIVRAPFGVRPRVATHIPAVWTPRTALGTLTVAAAADSIWRLLGRPLELNNMPNFDVFEEKLED